MSLSITELTKAIGSLEEALNLHDSAKTDSLEQRAFRDACIQRFEYCIELAWKVAMKALGSTTAAAKPAVREMARSNLIANPVEWIEFIEARNHSSHSYDDQIANKVFYQIRKFLPAVKGLTGQLQKIVQ